jgi:predicted protein tyrosine phosphatase
MKIDLTICGVHELPDHEGTAWTHVISIWDKNFIHDLACREKVNEIAPGAKTLFCFFEDTANREHPDSPRLQDVERILAFTSKLPVNAKVLVHCRAGVSRSTATAYAILCQHSATGMEMENLLHVETLRTLVMPNRLIIEWADQVLQRKGGMLLHLHRDW